ncbi:MAG TPA: tetratricopeptide repeat protein [Blastocatellia bacterium]|nr:tetratricopeptide repeat protein [Blastocatellia bacterium]
MAVGSNSKSEESEAGRILARFALFAFLTLAGLPGGPAFRAQSRPAAVSEALAAWERGEAERARTLLEEALKTDPRNTTALTVLGLIADRAGDLAESERRFKQVVKLDPNSPATRNNYGAILLKLGRRQEAAEQFKASLDLDPRQLSALVNLAQLRAALGTREELRAAWDLFERAAAIAPDAEIARAQTVIALQLGDREAAIRSYQAYTRLSVSPSPAVEARAELGSALLEAGLFREAATELTAAVQAAPSNPETIWRLAKAHLELGELPAAGRTLEAAIVRGVETAPIYALLATIYEKTGHLEQAIPAMRLALERDPQSEQQHFAYGMLLTNAMAPAAAAIRLEESLRRFPDSSRLWFALGIAHFKQNQNPEATRAFSRAAELDPKFAAPLVYLGMTEVEKGAYEEALTHYQRALAIQSSLGIVNYLIADALTRQSAADPARIEAALQRTIQLEPSFAPARLALAKLQLRANRLEEARAELERVIALDPKAAEAHYQLGRLYSRLRKMDEARASMARFQELSETEKEQGLKERQQIIERLAKTRF